MSITHQVFLILTIILVLIQLPTFWVVASLVPIVGGVALASVTEASFNWYNIISAYKIINLICLYIYIYLVYTDWKISASCSCWFRIEWLYGTQGVGYEVRPTIDVGFVGFIGQGVFSIIPEKGILKIFLGCQWALA